VAGWACLALIKHGAGFELVWSGLGFCLFSGLAVAWHGARPLADTSASSSGPACEIYLIGLNLALAAAVLAGLAL
jgi:hypothetical protein